MDFERDFLARLCWPIAPTMSNKLHNGSPDFLPYTRKYHVGPLYESVLLICFSGALDHTWRTIIGSAINGGGAFNRDTYYMLRRLVRPCCTRTVFVTRAIYPYSKKMNLSLKHIEKFIGIFSQFILYINVYYLYIHVR